MAIDVAGLVRQRIREVEVMDGVTVYRIAQAIGISDNNLTKFMKGRGVRLTTLNKLMGVLGMGVYICAKCTISPGPGRGRPASNGANR